MAVLIPALDSRVSRKTPGVRRLAERLAHKRDSGYLPWYCVPTALRNKQFSFKTGKSVLENTKLALNKERLWH